MIRTPREQVLASWHDSIAELGSKNISMRSLLRVFGLQRRGPKALEEIKLWLRANGIYTHGLDLQHERDIEDTVTLAAHEILQVGILVKAEKELYPRFESEIMPHLGLVRAQQHYSPKGTRDVFDYLCWDAKGLPVVVEIKRRDGEKRSVEQVMRYIGQLRAEGQARPRGVLITGVADPHTRRALCGRENDAHIDWYVYGIIADRIEIRHVDVSAPAVQRALRTEPDPRRQAPAPTTSSVICRGSPMQPDSSQCTSRAFRPQERAPTRRR